MNRRGRQFGFTLIELMVSVAILAIMILIVNEVLANATRTVRIAQDRIRCNANARAIAERLRNDLACVTQEGYLAIVSSTSTSGQIISGGGGTWPPGDNLSFLTVEPFESRMYCDGEEFANAQLIVYGTSFTYYIAPPWVTTQTGEVCLFRNPRGIGTAPGYAGDGLYYNYYFADLGLTYLRSLGRAVARYGGPALSLLKSFDHGMTCAAMIVPPGCPEGGRAMFIPASGTGDANYLWPYLAPDCSQFTVEWTDGQTDPVTGAMRWYGSANPRDNPAWKGRDYAYQAFNPTQDAPEFKLNGPAGTNAYCALWLDPKRNNWPKALRIRYTLLAGRVAGNPGTGYPMAYEVVMDLAK